jgi:hypothetical protein
MNQKSWTFLPNRKNFNSKMAKLFGTIGASLMRLTHLYTIMKSLQVNGFIAKILDDDG